MDLRDRLVQKYQYFGVFRAQIFRKRRILEVFEKVSVSVLSVLLKLNSTILSISTTVKILILKKILILEKLQYSVPVVLQKYCSTTDTAGLYWKWNNRA